MSEYRFHLQKYRPGSKTACPGCGRKACFTRYIDEERQVSFPCNVGKCDHINSCGYHYAPKEYFYDKPDVKENLTGQDRYGNVASTVIKPVVNPSPAPNLRFLIFPMLGWSSLCRGLTSTLCIDTLPLWQARRKRTGCSISIKSAHPRCGTVRPCSGR